MFYVGDPEALGALARRATFFVLSLVVGLCFAQAYTALTEAAPLGQPGAVQSVVASLAFLDGLVPSALLPLAKLASGLLLLAPQWLLGFGEGLWAHLPAAQAVSSKALALAALAVWGLAVGLRVRSVRRSALPEAGEA